MASVESLLLLYAVDVGGFARDLLGWTPDDKQALVLQTGSRRVILNCSRQWGKSTVAATKILHFALTRPGITTLIVCENLQQTAEVLGKIDEFLRRLGVVARGERGKRMGRWWLSPKSRV